MAFVMATAGQRFSLEAKARAPIGRLSRSQATPPPVFASQNVIARLGICPRAVGRIAKPCGQRVTGLSMQRVRRIPQA